MFRVVPTAMAKFLGLWFAAILLCPVGLGKAASPSDVIRAKGAITVDRMEVRCELPPTYALATTVLQVVPEGAQVAEGDLLVRFDAAPLEDERNQRELDRAASEAELIKADIEREVSEMALEEFLKGTYVVQEAASGAAVALAEAALKLATEKKASPDEAGQREFAIEKAQQELRLAKLKMEVLKKYTKPRTLKQLEGAVRVATTRLELAKQRHRICTERLEILDAAIKSCVVRSPIEGRVGHYPSEIRPGSKVRSQQVLLRLYDPRRIQFQGALSKADAERVREGSPAIIRVDAYPRLKLKGKVLAIESRSEKELISLIEIADPPEGLRPEMTGEAIITLTESPAAKSR